MHGMNGVVFTAGISLWTALGATMCAGLAPVARDPWLWPFADRSIWNMPVGDKARLVAANLPDATHAGADINHLVITRSTHPDRKVFNSPTWGPGRCGGTIELGFALRIPDGWIVPDAGNSPWGLTPNSNFALLLPSADTVFEGCQISRCDTAGPAYLPEWMKWPANRHHQALRGDGLSGGGQGASGMSALGGTIRLGELTNADPLRHAVKINPYAARLLHYGADRPGFRWPARSADGYAATTYKGANRSLVMGSLLVIPPSATEQSLGLTTAPGRKLFFAMQNYGVYFTDDAAWDTWDLIVERGVETEFQSAFGFSLSSATWRGELNRLMKALWIVDNNSPDSIGGGGTPRQPLAPPFGTVGALTLSENDDSRRRTPAPLGLPGVTVRFDGRRLIARDGWNRAGKAGVAVDSRLYSRLRTR